MTIVVSTTKMKNQRIATRLRRIQGQVATIERSLATDPNYGMLLQRVAAARGTMAGLLADLKEE